MYKLIGSWSKNLWRFCASSWCSFLAKNVLRLGVKIKKNSFHRSNSCNAHQDMTCYILTDDSQEHIRFSDLVRSEPKYVWSPKLIHGRRRDSNCFNSLCGRFGFQLRVFPAAIAGCSSHGGSVKPVQTERSSGNSIKW